MSISEIVELVLLGVSVIGLISSIVISLRKGEMKEFIIAKMEEAEEKFKGDKDKARKKLDYVINAVKEKYKLISLFSDLKRFIEKVIEATKKINTK